MSIFLDLNSNMNNLRCVMPLLMLILLVPVTTIHAQTTISESSNATSHIPGDLSPTNNTVGPVGTVGVYEKAYNELEKWWNNNGTSISVIDGLPISGIGVKYGEMLFIDIDERDVNQIDQVTQKFQELYPDINMDIGTIGEGEWHNTPSVSVCTSKTDDCNPQQAGMKAYGLNSNNTTAESFTITMGYETDDGEKGFLAPKHSFGLDETGNAVYRTISGTTPIDKHGEVLTNTGLNSRSTLASDTVFVEFEKEKICTFEHPRTNTCLRYGQGE